MGVAKIKDKSHIPVPRPGVPCQIGGQKIQRALADSRNFRENKDGESARFSTLQSINSYPVIPLFQRKTLVKQQWLEGEEIASAN